MGVLNYFTQVGKTAAAMPNQVYVPLETKVTRNLFASFVSIYIAGFVERIYSEV